MNLDLNDQSKQVLLLIVVIAAILYYLHERREKEGYERAVIGGEYGQVQNEIFYHNYPHHTHPRLPMTGPRYAKYSLGERHKQVLEPCDKLHSVSYVNQDANTTINEPHRCSIMQNPPAFSGAQDSDVVSYGCPQPKVFNSGR